MSESYPDEWEGPDDLDETDLRLLECVDEDFDVSLKELSAELGLSNSAIHYRLNKLKEAGVIDGVTADVDPTSLGLNMVAITEVSVVHEPGYSEHVGTDLADIDGVEQLYYTMGDVDFVAISRVQNRSQMNRLIEKMVAVEGVDETSSRFVMDELKTAPRTVATLSEGMRENLVEDE
ncbi:Lrp/AsnC family transcriptional regulator [Haloplanus rallus]|jgi:DNA-binding Lrp family transcriptional regulator|uniref:Lrp/AsnC family transcriptional regulator n=1 Tax=Haloplanus rallus TaxID=1816183 RepID=A0A6B9F730_9EURY|nr:MULTISPECIES: Lrp/AsnC family transcriptional regulator [Haloplanus]QGX94227.1 Lrp/AsnC family transcriptional regulator [Haloplanus rallus]